MSDFTVLKKQGNNTVKCSRQTFEGFLFYRLVGSDQATVDVWGITAAGIRRKSNQVGKSFIYIWLETNALQANAAARSVEGAAHKDKLQREFSPRLSSSRR